MPKKIMQIEIEDNSGLNKEQLEERLAIVAVRSSKLQSRMNTLGISDDEIIDLQYKINSYMFEISDITKLSINIGKEKEV